jgi:hypothetical protein
MSKIPANSVVNQIFLLFLNKNKDKKIESPKNRIMMACRAFVWTTAKIKIAKIIK